MYAVTSVPLYYDACVIFPHVIFFSSIKTYKIKVFTLMTRRVFKVDFHIA